MIKHSTTDSRRQVLRVGLKLITAILIAAVVWVSISFFATSNDSKTYLSQLKIPLLNLQDDKPIIFTWEHRPVLIMKRSPYLVQQHQATEVDLLVDSDSQNAVQPDWVSTSYRSRVSNLFVVIASGTDLGCPIEFIPENQQEFLGTTWHGGFQDTCRGSRYDLAGRVYIKQNTNKNLAIPPYKVKGQVVVLGLD